MGRKAPDKQVTGHDVAGDIPAEGRLVRHGVGLRESEHQRLKQIADEHSLAVNGLIRLAVRRFLADYAAGRVDLDSLIVPKAVTKKLDL